MKKILSMMLILCSLLFAQESFESYSQKENTKIQNYTSSFEKEYNRYLEEEKKAYNSFIKEIEEIWGEGDVKLSTKTTWVDYDKKKTERSIVDFKNNEASIEIIVDKKEAGNEEKIIRELINRVDQLVKNKGKTRDYNIKDEKQKELLDKPILEGQLELRNGKKVTPKNSKEFAKETVKNSKIEKENTSKDKIVIRVTFPLAPSSIRTRAEMFSPMVKHYSNIYGLKPELVMAIIHTESSFNPKAQSHVPAYGLMQLVPSSGGLDASRFVYNQDLMLTSNILFDPQKNIELGCAYIYLLGNRYLKAISNDISREYCVISAYNTGSGNLSKTFTGESKINKAVKSINEMMPSEVYSNLIQKLPFKETRDYLERVTSRMKLYIQDDL